MPAVKLLLDDPDWRVELDERVAASVTLRLASRDLVALVEMDQESVAD